MTGIVITLLLLLPAIQDPAALIEQLRADDIAERERAFTELEKLGPAVEDLLKKAAADRDAEFAGAAKRLLRIIELERTFSSALKKAAPGIVRRLCRSDQEWTRQFLEIAKDDRSLYRDLRREDIEPLAANAVKFARTHGEKVEACRAAGKWFLRSAEPALVALLRDDDVDAAADSANALMKLRGDGAIGLLAREAGDRPRLFMRMMVWVFADRGESLVPRLIPFLSHKDREMRDDAAQLLEVIGSPRAIDGALSALSDESEDVRISALSLLATMDAHEAAPQLRPSLKDPHPSVKAKALDALLAVDADVPITELRDYLAWQDSDLQRAALRFVGGRRLRDAMPDIVSLLKDSDMDVRLEAFKTVKKLGVRGQEAAVESHLKDPEGDIRAAALECFLKSEKGPELAKAALADNVAEVREKAVGLLVTANAKVDADTLEAYLKNPDDEIHAAVLGALVLLQRADPRRLRPVLERFLEMERFSNSWQLMSLVAAQPDPIPLLIKALGLSEFQSDRAAEKLVTMDSRVVIPAIRDLARKADFPGRGRAALLLAQLGVEDVRSDVRKLIGDPDATTREAAVGALNLLGPAEDTKLLVERLEDDNLFVRSAAARTLGRWGVKEAIPALRKVMAAPNAQPAEAAADALWEMRDPEVVATGARWLESESPIYLSMGTAMLGSWAVPADTTRIARLLEHRDPEYRKAGARVLASIGAKDRSAALLPLLREPATQESAALALSALDARERIPDLILMLKDTDAVTRSGALIGLSCLQATEALPAIRALLKDPDLIVRSEAVLVVGRMGDRESIPALREMLRNGEDVLKEFAARAAGAIGARETIPELLVNLDSPGRCTAMAACDALVELGASEAIPTVLKLVRRTHLQYWRSEERAALAFNLVEAVPDLLRRADRAWGRTHALNAAARLKPDAARPIIKEQLFDPEMTYAPHVSSVNQELAHALAISGDRSALLEFLSGPTPDGRGQAASALAELGDDRGVPSLLAAAEAWAPYPLHSLNALRRPAMWKKLSMTRFTVPVPFTTAKRFVDLIGKQAGIAVHWPETRTRSENEWLQSVAPPGQSCLRVGALEILQAVFRVQVLYTEDGYYAQDHPQFDFILEDDGLRLLGREDAIKFWKQWWKEEQAKKK